MYLVGDILDRAVRYVPNKTAIIFRNHSYTFRQLEERVNRLANTFLDMGLGRGDRVATIIPNIPEFHETFFAASKSGLVFAPLNYRYSGEEIVYTVNDLEASVMVIDERYIENVEPIRTRIPTVKHFICIGGSAKGNYKNYEQLLTRYPTTDPNVEISSEDLASIMYTGGTTARPKGVVHTHRSLCAAIRNTALLMMGEPGKQVCIFASPTYHVTGGIKVLITTYVLNTAILLESFTPELLLQSIEKHKATNYCSLMVPAALTRLLDHSDFGKYDLSSLQMVCIGGDIMNPKIVRRAIKAFGPIIYTVYSETESGGVGLGIKPGEWSLDLPSDKIKRLESCGKPDCFCGELRVVNESGRDVLPGDVGEIIFRGEGIMKGYWKMPEETSKVIDKDGWLHSGDLATVDEDGYVYIKGREKDMIRSGGENIVPAEIEEVIKNHPAVQEVAVIGVPDDYWGESVKAVVVLREGVKATQDEIIEFCKQRLASYKKPKSVDFVDSLPMSASGLRVSKEKLRERYRKR